MKKFLVVLSFSILSYSLLPAQQPVSRNSADILLGLKKLNVLGSVLYIAAHPDDENTRLLAYFSKEKLYRTGYLSLTRGDGGQNLIGDEQGVELGLIRTQELLAARRIDGAEQFFSSAYDFGFSKSTNETLHTWDHDKVLSDAVWVIRKFQPDIIITRFPPDSRAGHGHHSASSVIAAEAFIAAADPAKFPEQLRYVKPWQAKRLLWNTFNFGGNNTQREDQFKVDVGGYNPLLGKSYGEIAALSRSQHKSQGFGVAAQRGTSLEYFETTKGEAPVNDLFDGIDAGWKRTGKANGITIQQAVGAIIADYSPEHPEKSVQPLVRLYQQVKKLNDVYWKEQKLKEIQQLIEACSGLFLEATTSASYAVQGDSLKITITCNNRLGVAIKNVDTHIGDTYYVIDVSEKNNTVSHTLAVFVSSDKKPTQPYWLENPMKKGCFIITDQQLVGKAENDPPVADFMVTIEGEAFVFKKPIRYKYTDPVKGELYQPIAIVPAKEKNGQIKRVISYDHIPTIVYFKTETPMPKFPLPKITGKKIGYIEGAGDKVIPALQLMGYEVTVLTDAALANEDLSGYQAIITGVRAYNVRESLNNYYDKLMKYIENGGNLIVQYNTSNQLGPLKAKIGPYPFTVSRNRITEEDAAVKIEKPDHPLLNYPNKITASDFEGWVQERSIYHAQGWDSHYETIFAMHDEGEKDDEGSLILTKYGKGHFVYTGLVFFRELPAGVEGAYKLLANIISLK